MITSNLVFTFLLVACLVCISCNRNSKTLDAGDSYEAKNPFDPEDFVLNYYAAINYNEFDRLKSFYADTIRRYHGRYNITKEEAVDAIKYFKKDQGYTTDYGVYSNTITTHTLETKTIISFELSASSFRIYADHPLKYKAHVIMQLNEEYKMDSINEEFIY